MVSSDYATALAANRITEEEFYEAWQGALEKLSLAPKLITKDDRITNVQHLNKSSNEYKR